MKPISKKVVDFVEFKPKRCYGALNVNNVLSLGVERDDVPSFGVYIFTKVVNRLDKEIDKQSINPSTGPLNVVRRGEAPLIIKESNKNVVFALEIFISNHDGTFSELKESSVYPVLYLGTQLQKKVRNPKWALMTIQGVLRNTIRELSQGAAM